MSLFRSEGVVLAVGAPARIGRLGSEEGKIPETWFWGDRRKKVGLG